MQRYADGLFAGIEAEEAQRRVIAIEHAVVVDKDHRIAGKLPDGAELFLVRALLAVVWERHGYRRHDCAGVDKDFAILAGRGIVSLQPTSRSARNRIAVDSVRPSVAAVFTLITNSNFVGRSIGMSPGLAPFRILSTKTAAWR